MKCDVALLRSAAHVWYHRFKQGAVFELPPPTAPAAYVGNVPARPTASPSSDTPGSRRPATWLDVLNRVYGLDSLSEHSKPPSTAAASASAVSASVTGVTDASQTADAVYAKEASIGSPMMTDPEGDQRSAGVNASCMSGSRPITASKPSVASSPPSSSSLSVSPSAPVVMTPTAGSNVSVSAVSWPTWCPLLDSDYMTDEDAVLSGIDFHCSQLLDMLLQDAATKEMVDKAVMDVFGSQVPRFCSITSCMPARESCVACLQADTLDALRVMVWEFRSSLTNKQSLQRHIKPLADLIGAASRRLACSDQGTLFGMLSLTQRLHPPPACCQRCQLPRRRTLIPAMLSCALVSSLFSPRY